MRVSTAVAVLILAAGVAPSVALPSGRVPAPMGPRPQQPPPALSQLKSSGVWPLSRPKGPRPPPEQPAPPSPALSQLSLLQLPHNAPPYPGTPSPLHLNFVSRPSTPRAPTPPVLARHPSDPEPAPVEQLQKLPSKFRGRTLIADSDEVVGQPYSRRELLERFDELIMLAARAYEYEQELPATPMDNLD